MNIATTNVIAKIAAVVAGLGLVAMSFASFAPAARAATVDELQAQINALLAQISGMQGANTSTAQLFTSDLTIGSTGPEVTSLQGWLISKGYSIPAGATGYFGAQTQAALAAYQAANGISPAAGYFGPLTRAKVNASLGASGNTGTGSIPGNPSPSSDEEGYLDDFDQIGSYSNEEVGEDEEDVGVLGVEMKAVDADQTIERVTVIIDTPAGTTPSDDLEDYATDVSIWLDGEELDRMDVEDASHDRADDEYTFRFTGLDGMIAEGDMGELVVAVTGVNNLNSSEEGDGWDVTIPADGIRAVSPNGVDDTYDSSEFTEDFTVETFSSANDVELRLSLGDENPEEGVVVVDTEGDEIVLLEGELRADGSDIDLFELMFTIATTSADLADIMDEVVLEIDGEEHSENVPTASPNSVTFDDVEISIGEDDTVSFRLVGMSATSSVNGLQGIEVSASLATSGIDAEDQSGEEVTDFSGSINGESQHLFSVVPEIEVIDSIEDFGIVQNDNGDAPAESATATIIVDVTARGGTIFLGGDDNGTAAGTDAFFVGKVYGSGVTASTTASSTTYSLSGQYTTNGTGATEEYEVVEDETVRITITSVVNQSIQTTSTVLAGLRAAFFQFGLVTGTTNAIQLDWTDLTDETQTGTVPLVNPS